MNKQMRAEVFRIKNTGAIRFGSGIIYLSFFMLFLCVMPFANGLRILKQPLSVGLSYYFGLMYIILFIIQIIILMMLAPKYQSRIYYYEIMQGNGTVQIIMTNIVVYSAYALISYGIPNLIIYGIIAVKNGRGCYTANIGLLILIYGIYIIRAAVRAVLITMMLRRAIPAALVLYFWFLGEEVLVTVVNGALRMINTNFELITNLFLCRQIALLQQITDISRGFVLWTIAGLLVEGAVLFIGVWYSYKKKNFR